MRAHGVIDKLEQRRAIITAPFFVIFRLKAPQIGDEVRLPNAAALDFRNVAPALPPLVGPAAVTIGKHEVIVENVVEIAVAVDDYRCIGQGNHPDRRFSLGVEMLMPGIERRREKAALLPLQRVFFAALVPDGRGTLPFQNENSFFIHMTLRLELATGRNFFDQNVAGTAGAVHIGEGGLAAITRPVA